MDKKSNRSQSPASAHPSASMKPQPRLIKQVTSARLKPGPAPTVAPKFSVPAPSLVIARAAVLKFAGSDVKPMSKVELAKFLKRV